MKKLLLLIPLFLFFLSLQSEEKTALFYFEKDQKRGWDLYLKATNEYLFGDLKKAIKLWQESAKTGNLHSQARLFQQDLKNKNQNYARGYQLLLKSNFTLKDYLKAKYSKSKDREKIIRKTIVDFESLENSADFWLLTIIGKYYLNDSLKKSVFLKGLKYLTIAGLGNYTPAQIEIGLMFQKSNKYVKQNSQKSVEWLGKAAQLKDKYGCLYLAQYLQTGADSFKPNIHKAMPYYEESFRQGMVDAAVNLGAIYEFGVNYREVIQEKPVLKVKETIQIKPDKKKSEVYFQFVKDHGDLELFIYLGTKYFYSKDRNKASKTKGLVWYRLGAEVGTIVEKYKYANFFFKDKDIQDYVKARKLFEKLIPKKGQNFQRFHILVYLRLGQIYFDGLGVKQDYLKAKEYYDKINYTSEALERIISMYLNGWGVKQDDDMLMAYIFKLLDPNRNFGYKPAPYFTILGDIYVKRKELTAAKKYYRLAAISGYEKAINSLIKLYGELDKWEKSDIADIYFSLKLFDKALKYYSSIKKPTTRTKYFLARMYSIPEFKKFDIKKFLKDMQPIANSSSHLEKKDPIDRVYTDRVLDPFMIGQDFYTRSNFILGEYHAEMFHREKKESDLKSAHQYFMNSFLLGGHKNGKLDAAKILVYQKKYKPLRNKGLELFREEHQKKNAFASAILYKYYDSLKPTKENLILKLQYFEDAKKFDNGSLWRKKPVKEYLKSSMEKVMEILKQNPKN